MNLREMLTRNNDRRLPAVLPHVNETPVEIAIVPPTEYQEGELIGLFNFLRSAITYNACYEQSVRDAFRVTGRAHILALKTVEQTRLAKRVGSMIKKEYGIKLESSALEYIGNIDQKYRATSMTLDVTDVFNWNAGDFSDNGSCYWNPSHYQEARLSALPKAGAYALRSYDKNGKGNGRCWVIPVPWGYQGRSQSAPPMYVLTNNYGAMAGVNREETPFGARAIVAWLDHFTETKWTFRKLNQYTYDHAYINGDSWLVYPVEGVKKLPDSVNMKKVHFVLPEPQWAKDVRFNGHCPMCGRRSGGNDLGMQVTQDGRACRNCISRDYIRPTDLPDVWVNRRMCREVPDVGWVTVAYWRERFFHCELANKSFPIDQGVDVTDGYGDVFRVSIEAALQHTSLIGATRYLTSKPNHIYRRTVRVQPIAQQHYFDRNTSTVFVNAVASVSVKVKVGS